MTDQNHEAFSMELTDAELAEINGGALNILKGFPLGTIHPELILSLTVLTMKSLIQRRQV